jgi:hypothetical protein
MRYLPRMVLGLVVVVTLGGSLALLGCGGDSTEDASASNTNNLTFAFPNGVAFNPNLNNIPVNLTFRNSSTVFTLLVPGSSSVATGTSSFGSGSCTLSVGPSNDPLAVGGGSNFRSGAGPQPGEILVFNTCEFDTDNDTLDLKSGFGESQSSSAIPAP